MIFCLYYNMDISIFKYKCRLELIIIIILLFWIMIGHTCLSCTSLTLSEGLEMIKTKVKGETPMPTVTTGTTTASKEGFKGIGIDDYANVDTPLYYMDPSKWAEPTLTYSPDSSPNSAIQNILDRPKQPIPLPSGELDMFSTTKFKPECCPNAYTTGSGCACMTVDQYKYVEQRGGNNTPPYDRW